MNGQSSLNICGGATREARWREERCPRKQASKLINLLVSSLDLPNMSQTRGQERQPSDPRFLSLAEVLELRSSSCLILLAVGVLSLASL